MTVMTLSFASSPEVAENAVHCGCGLVPTMACWICQACWPPGSNDHTYPTGVSATSWAPGIRVIRMNAAPLVACLRMLFSSTRSRKPDDFASSATDPWGIAGSGSAAALGASTSSPSTRTMVVAASRSRSGARGGGPRSSRPRRPRAKGGCDDGDPTCRVRRPIPLGALQAQGPHLDVVSRHGGTGSATVAGRCQDGPHG